MVRSFVLSRVLKALGVARSVWYARKKSEPRRPGRKRRPVPEALAEKVRAVAHEYPWWGYRRPDLREGSDAVVLANGPILFGESFNICTWSVRFPACTLGLPSRAGERSR